MRSSAGDQCIFNRRYEQHEYCKMAMAIFISRPNSHPFEERRVALTEPVKIGRSVAKSRPAANNCTFDCKVLSRNHAMLWYEGGKFFLQDTKSSNGTFVNNVRLSKGSEESEPKELGSSDIVQFGVDVVENSKKVTHGCIIATVTLFTPEGKEVTRSGGITRSVFALNESNVRAQEMWQLSQYLQDAMHREQLLETKLATLQRLITGSQAVAEETNQSIIHEDKLLSRLETLENQLELVTKDSNEDDAKKEVNTLQEDRHSYEMRAKESLRKVLQEKLEALQKLAEVERSCSSAEDECGHFKSLYDKSQEELQDLADKHSLRLNEMQALQDQMDEDAKRHQAVEEQMERDKSDLKLQLEEMYSREKLLSAKVESLEAESDFAKQQLTAMRAKLEQTKEELDRAVDSRTSAKEDATRQEDSVEEVNGPKEFVNAELAVFAGSTPDEEESDDSYSEEDLDSLREKLRRLKEDVKHKEKLCITLEGKLGETRSQLLDSQRKMADLKSTYELSGTQVNGQVETDDIQFLKDELARSQLELQQEKQKVEELEEQVMGYHLQAVDELSEGLDDLDNCNIDNEELISKEHVKVLYARNSTDNEDLEGDMTWSPEQFEENYALLRLLKERILEVKALVKQRHATMIKWLEEDACSESADAVDTLCETHSTESDKVECVNGDQSTADPKRLLEDSIGSVEEIKVEFADVGILLETNHREMFNLKDQLSEGKERVSELKAELNSVQAYTKEFRQQIVDLRDKLLEEQDVTRRKDEYVAQLRRELQELSRERDLMKVEKKLEHETVESARSAAREMQKQAARSAEKAGKNKVELSAVSDDNVMLKQKIQTLESELKRYRRENNRMSSDHSRLQTSYKELETQSRHRPDSLSRKQNSLRARSEKETQGSKESSNQMAVLQDHVQRLEKQLKDQKEKTEKDLRLEKDRSTTAMSYLVLVAVAVVAVLIAFSTDIVSIRPGSRSVLEVITWLWRR